MTGIAAGLVSRQGVATASHLRYQLTTFVAYDRRLAEAARAAGLPVEIPASRADESPNGEIDQPTGASAAD